MNRDNIAAIVVFYNPDDDVINNIMSYLDQVKIVFVIDNSTCALNNTIKQFLSLTSKIVYIPLMENRGIAYALNEGCRLAKLEGIKWVLTMDQDSVVENDLITKYIISYLGFHHLTKKVAIIAPVIELTNLHSNNLNKGVEIVDTVMTSASLMNLSAYENVGRFDEQLFIDWVDWDICFRLRLNEYIILRVNDARIIHKLGDTKDIRFFKKHIMYVTNHNSIRYYYKTRNALLLSRKYRKKSIAAYLFLRKSIITDFLKIIFFEIEKLRKIRSFFTAYKDYKSIII